MAACLALTAAKDQELSQTEIRSESGQRRILYEGRT